MSDISPAMALEHWELIQRQRGNNAGADIAATLRKNYGDVPLPTISPIKEVSEVDIQLTDQQLETATKLLGNNLTEYTPRAQLSIVLADEEANRFNHNYIGTEHLLLGMLRDQDSIANIVLTDSGVQLAKARSAVEFIIGRGELKLVEGKNFTPRAQRALTSAQRQRDQLNDPLTETSHILLGVLHDKDDGGIARGVLESLGINLLGLSQRVYQYKIIQAIQSPQE